VIVTGVQSVGAKGVSAVQVTAADPKDLADRGRAAAPERDDSLPSRSDTTQPVVFPRGAVALDHRPVQLRHQHAASRYRKDGNPDPDSDGESTSR
jgi:hypothetical protein